MNKTKLVSVIIVSWNGKHWLQRCLPSIKKQTYKNFEIICVDNGSTDGSVAWLKEKYPEIIVIPLEKNLGFADGNNKGFEKAQGEYIYFLNNDTELFETAISELVLALGNDNNVGGVQSKLLLLEDKKRLDTIGAFLTPTGFLYHNKFSYLDNVAFDEPTLLYTLKGASMMFRKKILDKVLLNSYVFDPDYFAYFEETDLCHRIWLAGYTLRYAPKAIVWHHMGATSSLMDNNYVQFHSFKNRVMTYLKLFEWRTLIQLLFTHLIICELFAFISLFRGKFLLWLNIQRAILWNLIHLTTIIRKRKIIWKNIKKVSDKDILPIILKHPKYDYYIHWLLGKPLVEDTNHTQEI